MACCRKIHCCLVFIALLPALVSCIRPFRVPRNLFRQGTSSLTLPEGVRIIRRETSDDPILEATHDLEEQHIRSRFRRDSQPDIDSTTQALGTYHNMYMYWPDSKEHEHYVFLLAKEPNPPISKASNPVYVSTNYGRNFTKKEFINSDNSTAVIDQIYFSKVDPTLAIFTDVKNKVLHRTDDLQTFNNFNIPWVPTYITFHPWNSKYVMGYDNTTEKLYVSSNKGKSFSEIQGGGNVKSFNWGVEDIDEADVIFVEQFQNSLQERLKTKDNRTKVTRMNIDRKNTPSKVIATDVDEFEMMKNYQFYTTKLVRKFCFEIK